jgi:ribosome-binding factor A
MPGRRIERVNELLLREISNYVLANQPPDTGFLTFTAVDTTADFMEAKVFYSVMGSDAERAHAAKELDKMRSDLTRSMRRLESLNRIPHFHFIFDETPSRAARVHDLIERANPTDPPAPPAPIG